MHETLQLRLLGTPEIRLDNQPLTVSLAAKAQALFYYLAISGRAHSRVALAGLLWGDMPEEMARTNLRKALADLRPVAGAHLAIDNQTVAISTKQPIWVDVLELGAKLNQRTLQADPQQLQSAVDLYNGDFLEGFYIRNAPDFETWVLTERTRYRQLVLQALRALASHSAHQGQLSEAIAAGRRLLALEPWDEEAHYALMQWLAQSGQRSAALAQYELCRRSLQEELAVEPSTETITLYEQIRTGKFEKETKRQGDKETRRQDSALAVMSVAQPHLAKANTEIMLRDPVSPSPLLPTSLSGHNLPDPLTPLIGRDEELRRLGLLLDKPECRLLTVVGAGGVGKTRLAVATARALLDLGAPMSDENLKSQIRNSKFHDGIYFVPLASVSAPSHIIPAIANAIGFTFYGQQDARNQLFGYLRAKQMLLVLDNLEHLLTPPSDLDDGSSAGDESIELLLELLKAAPLLKILATAREPLNLPSEWVFDLKGLRTSPASPCASSATETSPVLAWEDNDAAMTFFFQVAHRVKADFVLTAKEQAAVARICRLVDGLPLGIELAASWVRALSCQEIADEIQRNLAFLATTQRGLPVRHRSITAVFDYSWQLLAEEEQRVLRGLSVFRSGFTREAAVEVTGATLPILSTLIAKSLVRRHCEQRYELHELVRQYATSKLALAQTEQTAIQQRHSQHFLALLASRKAALTSSRQKEVIAEFSLEIDNIRQAWEWAVVQGEAAQLDRAAWSFWYFLESRNYFHEGEAIFRHAQEWLYTMCAVSSSSAVTCEIAWANMLSRQAFFTFRQGCTEQALSLHFKAVQCLRQHGDQAALADALWIYGAICMFLGKFNEAAGALQEGLKLCHTLNHPWLLTTTSMILGFVLYEQGAYEASYRLLQEALTLARTLGDPRELSVVSSFLSRTAQALGHYSEMMDLLHEALRLTSESGDHFGMAMALEQLAHASQTLGKEAETEAYLAEALALYRGIGDHWSHSRLLNYAGTLALDRGNEANAQQIFTQALQVALEGNTPPNALDALMGLATLQAKAGEFFSAFMLVEVIHQHPASTHLARDRAAQLQRDLLPQLTGKQVVAAQTQAQTAIGNGTWVRAEYK